MNLLFNEALLQYGNKKEYWFECQHSDDIEKLRDNIFNALKDEHETSSFYFYKHQKNNKDVWTKGLIYPFNQNYVFDSHSCHYLISTSINPEGKIKIEIFNITKKMK